MPIADSAVSEADFDVSEMPVDAVLVDEALAEQNVAV